VTVQRTAKEALQGPVRRATCAEPKGPRVRPNPSCRVGLGPRPDAVKGGSAETRNPGKGDFSGLLGKPSHCSWPRLDGCRA